MVSDGDAASRVGFAAFAAKHAQAVIHRHSARGSVVMNGHRFGRAHIRGGTWIAPGGEVESRSAPEIRRQPRGFGWIVGGSESSVEALFEDLEHGLAVRARIR